MPHGMRIAHPGIEYEERDASRVSDATGYEQSDTRQRNALDKWYGSYKYQPTHEEI